METLNNYEEFDANIDKFLRHQMTEEEENLFKSELNLNPEKRERARITALMIKKMHQEGMKYDHNIINIIRGLDEVQFRKALNLKSRVIVWSRMIKYSIAACLIGIISIGSYRYYEYNKIVSLGNSQYMAYVSDISLMNPVRGAIDDTTYKVLGILFANVKDGKKLKETIKELEIIYENSFVEILEYNEFQDDISWNLAIAYLKNGEREKPIPILEGMVKRNIGYPEIIQPAQKLIGQIKAL